MSLTLHLVFRLTTGLVGTAMALSSFELALTPLLHDHGLFSWPVLRLRGRHLTGLDAAARYPVIRAVMAVRALAAATATACAVLDASALAPLCAMLCTTVVLMLRGWPGTEGADHVILIVTVTLLLVSVSPSQTNMLIGAWFLALQAAVAYFSSGIYKAVTRSWRDGSGLTAILSAYSFGHPALGRLARTHPRLPTLNSWLVISFETLFPCALLHPAAAPLFLVTGAFFHIACAFVMGLNVFPWAFCSLYPSVLYIAWH